MKTTYKILVVFVLVVVLLSGCAYLPETGAVIDETGGLILPSLDRYLAGVLRPLSAAIILVLVNFGLGVLAAVLDKTFEWKRVADFLGLSFILNIGGWLLAEFLVQVIPAIYPDLPEWVSASMVLVVRGSLFTALLGSVLQKGQNMGLWKTGFGQLLSRIGVPPEVPTLEMMVLRDPVEPE